MITVNNVISETGIDYNPENINYMKEANKLLQSIGVTDENAFIKLVDDYEGNEQYAFEDLKELVKTDLGIAIVKRSILHTFIT